MHNETESIASRSSSLTSETPNGIFPTYKRRDWWTTWLPKTGVAAAVFALQSLPGQIWEICPEAKRRKKVDEKNGSGPSMVDLASLCIEVGWCVQSLRVERPNICTFVQVFSQICSLFSIDPEVNENVHVSFDYLDRDPVVNEIDDVYCLFHVNENDDDAICDRVNEIELNGVGNDLNERNAQETFDPIDRLT